MAGVDERVTYSVPRFLASIEIGWLRDAMLVALGALEEKRKEVSPEDRDTLGNLNAADQALRRAFLISAFSLFEQNLHEIALMTAKRIGVSIELVPNVGGVKKLLRFSKKSLGAHFDGRRHPWPACRRLRELRNHIVHYGSGFDDTPRHRSRRVEFKRIPGVVVRSTIYLEIDALETAMATLVETVGAFVDAFPDLPPAKPA